MLPKALINPNFIAISLISLVLCACVSTTNNKKAESVDVYLQLGERYLSMNKLEIAKENLEKASAIDSNNIHVHNAMAFLFEKIEKPDQAKVEYQKAYSLAPDDLAVQNNFGRFLCKHKEYEQGMALLTQASTNLLNDQQWMALTNAGICQLGMGQTSRAKSYFKQALQLRENYAPALFEMQKLSYQNKEYWPAKGYMERYLAVAQHTPETLWFAIQTERALGNQGLATEYKNLLLEKFPLSNEAKKIGALFH